MNAVNGVLVLHKPAGLTSHDCVSRVRRLFQTRRAGHTGTLDPEVTGVLPICLGNATRIVEYLQDLPKAYEVVMRLGTATTTQDAAGEVISSVPVDPADVTEERVRRVFAQFTGEISQVPPMFSAVKVNGQRLYELARQGREVERKPRLVTIYRLTLHNISIAEQIDLTFTCECSKGTYMRTLCVDLGKALGYPSHMARLVRVKSGPFSLQDAVTFDQLTAAAQENKLASLLVGTGDALSFLPRYDVPPHRKEAVLNGLATSLAGTSYPAGSLLRLYAGEQLLGVHRVCMGPYGPYAKAEKVFRS